MIHMGVYLQRARMISAADFAADFASKNWAAAKWNPKMFVLHNTGGPTLRDWLGAGATPQQRLANLQHYYKGMGWHSGPHWFVAPDAIWEFCNPLEDGVHCSCANHVAYGCEMVLDGSTESFDSGPGAQVRDNAVAVVSSVFKHFGWTPDPLVLWERGLAFHKNCVKDHHDCPGKHVDRADFVRRVEAAMGGAPIMPETPHPGGVVVDTSTDTRWLQRSLNTLLGSQLDVDGIEGRETRAALKTFQRGHGLDVDGVLGPKSIAAIKAALG